MILVNLLYISTFISDFWSLTAMQLYIAKLVLVACWTTCCQNEGSQVKHTPTGNINALFSISTEIVMSYQLLKAMKHSYLKVSMLA